jgi:hypothetical protein
MRWEIELTKHVKNYGIPFRMNIVKDIVIVIFGRHIKLLYQKTSIRESGKETGETSHVERWNNTLRQRAFTLRS